MQSIEHSSLSTALVHGCYTAPARDANHFLSRSPAGSDNKETTLVGCRRRPRDDSTRAQGSARADRLPADAARRVLRLRRAARRVRRQPEDAPRPRRVARRLLRRPAGAAAAARGDARAARQPQAVRRLRPRPRHVAAAARRYRTRHLGPAGAGRSTRIGLL